jgi:hypothetical protein
MITSRYAPHEERFLTQALTIGQARYERLIDHQGFTSDYAAGQPPFDSIYKQSNNQLGTTL